MRVWFNCWFLFWISAQTAVIFTLPFSTIFRYRSLYMDYIYFILRQEIYWRHSIPFWNSAQSNRLFSYHSGKVRFIYVFIFPLIYDVDKWQYARRHVCCFFKMLFAAPRPRCITDIVELQIIASLAMLMDTGRSSTISGLTYAMTVMFEFALFAISWKYLI